MADVAVYERKGARGSTWRLQGRAGGRTFVRSFPAEDEALHWLGVFKSMRDNTAALAVLDAKLVQPKVEHVTTVRDVVEEYLQMRDGHVTVGTLARYRRESARDIYAHIGDLPIGDLNEEAVASWIGSLRRKRLSRKTIKNRLGVLSPACKLAVRKELLPRNPCADIKLVASIKRPMTFLELQEIKQLLATLDEIDSRYRNFITVLVGTGMRWGEATALDVRDIVRNSDGSMTIRVSKAWKEIYTGPPVLGPPKTEKGVRDILIPAGSSVAIALEKELQLRAKPGDLVFQTPMGKMLRNSEFHRRVWQPLLRELEARKFPKKPRIHDLRHTAASLMFNSGMPQHAVSEVLGHDKPSTTSDIYGHVMSGAKDTASATLANLIP